MRWIGGYRVLDIVEPPIAVESFECRETEGTEYRVVGMARRADAEPP